MKRLSLALAALLTSFDSFAASGGSPAAQWNNAFARDMLQKLGEEHRGENFAFSPFSIVTAFGMTYGGARGETAAQMEGVFRFDGGAQVHSELAAWAAAVKEAATGEGIQFRLANRAWLQRDWPVREEFLRVLQEQYDAPAARADFATQPETERVRINDWVYEQTMERIADLLPTGSIDGLTRFVLVNALYFKGQWKFPFTKTKTGEPFYVSEDETVPVAMMYGYLWVAHVATGLAEAIALPVKNSSCCLVIVRPNPGKTVEEVLTSVADGDFPLAVAEWNVSPEGTDVYLPRFRLETEVELKKVLQRMGVVDAFDAGLADFTGIYLGPEPELHLTDAFHKTFVEVNETGLEASGATAAVGGVTSVPPVFEVNRPFLFFVMEDSTGSILFGGQVTRPEDPGGSQGEPSRDRLLRLALSEGVGQRTFTVELVCDTNVKDKLILQASSDLSKWENIEFTVNTAETLSGNRSRFNLVGEIPPSGGDALFFRVRVALPEE